MIVFKCKKCGKVITILNDKDTNTICCEEEMEELLPNTVDASHEKHLPSISIDDDMVYVQIGDVEHPMTNEHYIEWIMCEYKDANIIKKLNPNDKPVAYFNYKEGIKIYAYCNLHGLWVKEL